MSKMSLTEATMLALQGKLVEEKATTKKPTKRLKKENIDINVDDKTNVSVMNNETIVDTEEATIIVDKKENEFVPETSDGIVDDTTLPMEAPVDTVEVPVEGDETIIPEEIVDEPIVEPSEENAIDGDIDLPEIDDEKEEESKKLEAKERTTKDVFVVQGNYGQGWEDVYESEDRKDAKDRLKEYNENEKEYAHKLITRRVKKESKKTCEKCDNEVCECDKKVESKKLQEKLGYEPGICPDCGSDDLSYEKPISYTDSIEYPFHCNNCGKDGAERYNLDFVEIETNELEENKKVTKKEFKFENKKLQEELTDEVYECAEKIAKEIEKVGIMNWQDVDDRICKILNLDYDDIKAQDIANDVYSCITWYNGLGLNYSTGDFYTEEYAEKHPEVLEESKKLESNKIMKDITNDDKSHFIDFGEWEHFFDYVNIYTIEKLYKELGIMTQEELDEEFSWEKLAEDYNNEVVAVYQLNGKRYLVYKDKGYLELPNGDVKTNLDFVNKLQDTTSEYTINEFDEKNKEYKEESKKLNEEVTSDTLVKIEPRYLQGYDQTIFFKVTYRVYKGYVEPIYEEIIGWCWGKTDNYDETSCNLKADYSDTLKSFKDDVDSGNTDNYMTIDSLNESKKLNEDYSAAPFRDLMYDCMRDDIEPGDVMADRMLSAWSDDDCKWYCETYELVEPYKDFSDENEYYKDVYGQIRDITGQVVGEDDEDLEEAKHRKVESIKKIEARKNKKFETVKRNIIKPNIKKVENKVTTKSIKGVNEALTKILKVEKVENAKIEEVNGKILLKAKVLNENKVKGICFEMKEIANTDKFTRYSLQEIKSLKIENKVNDTKYTMLVNKKDNMLECRYIIKK